MDIVGLLEALLVAVAAITALWSSFQTRTDAKNEVEAAVLKARLEARKVAERIDQDAQAANAADRAARIERMRKYQRID